MHRYKAHLFILTSFVMLQGCKTVPGDQASAADGAMMMAFAYTGIIITSPFLIAGKISDGTKPHIYAKPGTRREDFESSMNAAEGKECKYIMTGYGSSTQTISYRGKKALYFGTFKNGIAIPYSSDNYKNAEQADAGNRRSAGA